MDPLVSIILPTYNGEKYIRQSIVSCIKQTYTNIELVIVNDCSTDNTLQIIKEYAAADSRIRIVDNAVNKKLPQSLNAGFEIARGSYFTWTSDDNYYADNAIEELVKAITVNRDIDLVYSNYITIDDDGKGNGKVELGDINKSFMLWKGGGACFLYKADVHHRNKGYNPSTFLIEDYDFFLRAFFHSKFLYLNRTDLYYYRLHQSSLTGTMAHVIFDMQKVFVEKNIPLLLTKLSDQDKILLFRKFAVYYALFKNSKPKLEYYLSCLYSYSVPQTILTVGYISVKKLIQFFHISGIAFFSLLKLVAGIKKKR